MEKIITKRCIGVAIALTIFFLQAISLPHVGMTWDEPSSFFFGRANLKFWLTRDREYLTDVRNNERFGNDPFQYIYGEDVYPPFPFVVASATSAILSERLHLMHTITAHHVGLLAMGAVGIVAMYGIATICGFSPFVSAIVTVLYATYPTIVGQMRNDAKDIPLMSMIVVFVWCFLRWVKATQQHKKSRHLFGILAALSLGLAEGSKTSAVIIVPIIVGWFIVALLINKQFKTSMGSLPQRVVEGIFFALLAGVTFIGSWPWLWDDPVSKLQHVWSFFKTVGFNMPTLYLGTVYRAGITLPWHYPFGLLLFQTPPTLLLIGMIGVIGVIGGIIKKKNIFALLVLLWIVIGMGRFFIPGILIYAKVRHFIDVMPAFILLVGFGLQGISNLRSLKNVGYLIGVVLVLHQLVIMMQFFPYEPSYFNSLVGGSKTVAEKRLFDIEYWASSVKEAMEYINTTAEKPVVVYSCMMGHVARFYTENGTTVTGVSGNGQYAIVPNSASWFDGAIDFLKKNHENVYTVKRAGAELFYVYKYSQPFFWNCGNETKSVYSL